MDVDRPTGRQLQEGGWQHGAVRSRYGQVGAEGPYGIQEGGLRGRYKNRKAGGNGINAHWGQVEVGSQVAQRPGRRAGCRGEAEEESGGRRARGNSDGLGNIDLT